MSKIVKFIGTKKREVNEITLKQMGDDNGRICMYNVESVKRMLDVSITAI